MALAIRESVMISNVRLYKLNQYSDLGLKNQFLFLIRNVFLFARDSKIGPISYNFGFDLRYLSSRDSIEQLSLVAVESTEQFIDQSNIRDLAAGFSDYLADNFEFDVDALWRNPNSPRIVIVVNIDRTLGFFDSRVSGDFDRPNSGIDHEDDDEIVPALRNLLQLPHRLALQRSDSDEPHGLTRVPALDVFERCGGECLTGSCAICLEELSAEMDVRRMPCNHLFHGSCVARWLWRKTSCPMCRSELV